MIIDSFSGKYDFLSNFYPCYVEWDNLLLSSSEHAYHYEKTLDAVQRWNIANASTAGLAKRLGRAATLRPGWDTMKDRVMAQVLVVKFWTPELRQKLLATGDAVLVEGNTWHDNHFGSCRCVDCRDDGENILGKLLMSVRAMCKELEKEYEF